jgi:hypothetical protein
VGMGARVGVGVTFGVGRGQCNFQPWCQCQWQCFFGGLWQCFFLWAVCS